MFCEKCGRKEKEMSTFDCIEEKLLDVEIKNIQKKRKLFYWWIRYCTLLFVVSFSFFLITGCSDENKNETEVIEKLRSITRLENDEECYVFSNNVEDTEALEWELRYTEENEAVRFEEKAIVESIDNYFGEECVEKGGFVYDLSENEVRIYLETEVQGGILTIINYIIDEDETTVMIDGKRYSAADNIVDIMEEKNLVNIMKDDIDKFRQQLEKNSISFGEILDLKYEDIVKYIKNKNEEIPVFEENEETNREENSTSDLAMYLSNDSGMLPVEIDNVYLRSDYSNYTTVVFDMINTSSSDIKEAVFGIVAWDSNKLPLELTQMYDLVNISYFYRCSSSNIAASQVSQGTIIFEEEDFKYMQILLLECTDFEGNIWKNPAASYYEEIYAGEKFDETTMNALIFN